MLGWVLFGVSAFAAFSWGNWFAIGNAIANFWSLGVMNNYDPSTPVRSDGERFAVLVNIATSLLGVVLLIAALGRR